MFSIIFFVIGGIVGAVWTGTSFTSSTLKGIEGAPNEFSLIGFPIVAGFIGAVLGLIIGGLTVGTIGIAIDFYLVGRRKHPIQRCCKWIFG